MIYGIIDIDNFTDFNIQNSFEYGNDILSELEALINLIIKPSKFKRLDGDEFLFAVRGTFENNKSNLIKLMLEVEKQYRMTISIGLLELKINYSFKSVISDLKLNLIQAKRYGKNKIFIDYEICTNR